MGQKLPAVDKQQIQPLPPTLSIRDLLDAPLAELGLSLENEALRSLPENLRGKCCAPLRELPESRIVELLCGAAQIRLAGKAGVILARAKNSGWEQGLRGTTVSRPGLQKHNVWPLYKTLQKPNRAGNVAHIPRLNIRPACSELAACYRMN